MGRAPCCDKANVKKGPWSPEEDAKLKHFIDTNGTGGNWITLPSKAGLKRCGKSCRLRWINYLRPDIKHGSFTEEEERIIYQFHATIGSRWSLIAAQLKGRTDNDIKNYWNTRLKKKLAERGSNSQYYQQHRYMRNATAAPVYSAGSTNATSDCGIGQMMHGHLLQYYQQQEQQQQYNAPQPQQASQQVTLPPFSQQQQVLTVKNELVNAETEPNKVMLGERLMVIENFVKSCLPGNLDCNGMTACASPVQGHPSGPMACVAPVQGHPSGPMACASPVQGNPSGPMSPIVGDGEHQSPSSSCSGLSSDRSYGQLADSAYSGTFSMCNNSYEDPARLADSQSSGLLSMGNVLSQQTQQLPNVRPTPTDHSSSAPTLSQESFGLDGFLEPYSSYQTSLLSDITIDRQAVKEELQTDWLPWAPSFVVSPTTPRSTVSRNWVVPSPRCGAENVFSAQHQTQTPSTPSQDVSFADQFIFKSNYVSI